MKHTPTRRAALPALCYALALLCWLARGTYTALTERALTPCTLPVETLEAVDLVVPQSHPIRRYTATSADPQLIWYNTAGLRVRTLSYRLDSVEGDLREVCLYYTTRAGEGFSPRRRVYPRRTAAGDYVFTLPAGPIAALRLDPCSPGDGSPVTLCFAENALWLNAAGTLRGWRHLLPDGGELFALLLYPALAAAALDWLRAVRRRRPTA